MGRSQAPCTNSRECARSDTFNRHWSRRVLGQNAAVLLITDGMERESAERLGPIMERLHKSCSQLLWLNPLLRFDAFAPLAHGIRQMLPHVDAFLPAHNVGSLMQLAEILGRPPARQQAGARPQHQAA